MSPKLLGSLLAVSLALNVFVVGGVLYSKFSEAATADPDAGVKAVAGEIGLNEAETQQLYAVRDTARAQRNKTRPNAERLRGEMVSLLIEPTFDQTRAEALWAERSEQRQQRILATMTEMHKFLATLTPEQRDRFVELAKERGFFRKLFGRKPKSG